MLATAVVEASCVAELPCSGASKLSRCYTAAESFYYAVRVLNARLLPPHDRPTNQLPQQSSADQPETCRVRSRRGY